MTGSLTSSVSMKCGNGIVQTEDIRDVPLIRVHENSGRTKDMVALRSCIT